MLERLRAVALGTIATMVLLATTDLPVAAATDTATAKNAIAILPFDVAGDHSAGAAWADLLFARISDRATVVERTRLEKILAEQKLSSAGLTTPETSVKLGKLIGAKTLLAGGVYEIGDSQVVTLREISTESGRAVGRTLHHPRGTDRGEVVGRLAKLVDSLQEPTTTEPTAPAAQVSVDFAAPAVAVLNFDSIDAVDPEWSWLATGLGDLTINLLASQNIRVVSRENMQTRLREMAVKQPSGDLSRVARVLRTERLVHGVYQVTGDQVQLRMVLLDAVKGTPEHTATKSGPRDQVFALHREATAEIVDVLEGRRVGTLDPTRLPVWNDRLDAGKLLYRGVELFDRGRYLDAWLLFRQSQQLAPQYPDAAYWSGRMMYYSLEYHQARHDLLKFLTSWTDHPRAGDAGLEIIHSAQSAGASEQEVLDTLALVGDLAPRAEVVNFTWTARPTLLGYYSDALAAQIHTARRRFRAAAEALGRHLHVVSRDHELYKHAWSRMFDFRVVHFDATGEWFELPTPPIYTHPLDTARSAGGKHPLSSSIMSAALFAGEGFHNSDTRIERPVVHLTLDQPSRAWNLRDDPLVRGVTLQADGRTTVLQQMRTFTHYIAAPPEHYLDELTVDVEAEGVDTKIDKLDVDYSFIGLLSGVLGGTYTRGAMPKNEPDHLQFIIRPPPGTRIIAVWPSISSRNWNIKEIGQGKVVGWSVRAKLNRFAGEPAGLIVRQPVDSPVKLLRPDGAYAPEIAGLIPNYPAGDHDLALFGRRSAPSKEYADKLPRQRFHLDSGMLTELKLHSDDERVVDIKGAKVYYDGGADLNDFAEIQRTGMSRAGDSRTGDRMHLSIYEDREQRLITVWSIQRDLYIAVSRDQGKTWSPARQLPVPVNSAHFEQKPHITQDREGRYVLAFLSDRGVDRNSSPYVCWSDDLEVFSAPVRVSKDGGAPHRLWQRTDGTYLLYAPSGRWVGTRDQWSDEGWVVFESRDLLKWSAPQRIKFFDKALDVIPDGDGFLAAAQLPSKYHRFPQGGTHKLETSFGVYSSTDGLKFEQQDVVVVQTVPTPTKPTAPGCFWITQLALQRVGERIFLYAGSRDGKVLRRDGSDWKEVIHLTQDTGFEPPQRVWFLGEQGYLRFAEGPLAWIPVSGTSSDGKGAMQYSMASQLSASRYRVNLVNPEPDETGRRVHRSLPSETTRLEIGPHHRRPSR